MQSKILVPRVEYLTYIERRLEEMAGQGREIFTFKDLSEYAKLPITPNMRRRIMQLVANGCLLIHPSCTGGRGSKKRFVFVFGYWPCGQGKLL